MNPHHQPRLTTLGQSAASVAIRWISALLCALALPSAAFAEQNAPSGIEQQIDGFFGMIVGWLATVLFWPIPGLGMPVVVLWLFAGAVYLTFRMRFVNIRMFRHAIDVVRGRYTKADDHGEVSHFQALSSALSATVGLGNIAGVAIAVGVGGPGATFWMIMAGFLGMTAKFTECTLGQRYRITRPDGSVAGGAMYYLSEGLKRQNMPGLGKGLAVAFALLCVGGSFGGGNAFQVNQSMGVLTETIPGLADNRWIYGLFMAVIVGIVIIGGIKRIAATAEKIVPIMCGVYALACIYILFANITLVPAAAWLIVSSAFTSQALFGGMAGALVQGIKRAAFSNEAGIGSAAIAHSAAKTAYPVREGIVALLEPFIDTIVICTMTALVMVLSGAYGTDHATYGALIESSSGAALTSKVMGGYLSWFPYVLSVAVFLFAYSTIISWSYYGERCWTWLFGDKSSLAYKIVFLVFVFLGSIVTSTNVLDLSDLMILMMAVPNILGLYILQSEVASDLLAYEKGLASGEIQPVANK
jgi:AGCS family alanine or glycine:cation symporter